MLESGHEGLLRDLLARGAASAQHGREADKLLVVRDVKGGDALVGVGDDDRRFRLRGVDRGFDADLHHPHIDTARLKTQPRWPGTVGPTADQPDTPFGGQPRSTSLQVTNADDAGFV